MGFLFSRFFLRGSVCTASFRGVCFGLLGVCGVPGLLALLVKVSGDGRHGGIWKPMQKKVQCMVTDMSLIGGRI